MLLKNLFFKKSSSSKSQTNLESSKLNYRNSKIKARTASQWRGGVWTPGGAALWLFPVSVLFSRSEDRSQRAAELCPCLLESLTELQSSKAHLENVLVQREMWPQRRMPEVENKGKREKGIVRDNALSFPGYTRALKHTPTGSPNCVRWPFWGSNNSQLFRSTLHEAAKIPP